MCLKGKEDLTVASFCVIYGFAFSGIIVKSDDPAVLDKALNGRRFHA